MSDGTLTVTLHWNVNVNGLIFSFWFSKNKIIDNNGYMIEQGLTMYFLLNIAYLTGNS